MAPVAIIENTFIYEIVSFTTDTTTYDLVVDATGHVESCSCKDFKFRGHLRPCKHQKALAAELHAAEVAAALAEIEAMIEEKARIEKAARFEAVKAEIEAINAKYQTQAASLIAEITAELEAERVNELAQAEAKEVALANAVEAACATEATQRRADWNVAHGYAPNAFARINTGKYSIAKADYHPDYQSAPTAPNITPIKTHRGFVMAPVAELGGRVVPLAS